MPLTAAPPHAAALMLKIKRSLFFLSLVAGGIPALWAIIVALSRKSPSLTAEYSGFIKNSTLSKYSHWVWVISTTCLLTPFIRKSSPFTLVSMLFLADEASIIPSILKDKYTPCIPAFSTKNVENRVENVYNSPQKARFLKVSRVDNFILLFWNIQRVV